MNQYTFGRIVGFFLPWHYDFKIDGLECMKQKDKVYLLMPNHVAFVDPIIVGGICWWAGLRPMSAKYLWNNKIAAWVLNMCNAIPVYEMDGTVDRETYVRETRALKGKALDTLNSGTSLLMYPSGHIKRVDKEIIGSRRLGYELCQELPEGVEVVMLRTRGLEGSCTSRLKHTWKLRRTVTMHFELMTDQVKEWAKEDRAEFNKHLEEWYNRRP